MYKLSSRGWLLLMGGMGIWALVVGYGAGTGRPGAAAGLWHGTPNPSTTPQVTLESSAGAVPTYYKDIEPLFNQHCLACHGAGGIGAAALALDNPRAVPARARAIGFVTATRQMPPWMPGPASPPMQHERKLRDDEIRLILAWVQGGAPLGNLEDRAGPATPPPLPTVRPDVVLEMAAAYTPSGTVSDDYRCFLLDPGFTHDTYVTGSTVIPGQPGLVHHVILFQVPGTARTQAQQRDGEDGRPGWTCYGGPGVGPGDSADNRRRLLEAMQAHGVDVWRLIRALNARGADLSDVDMGQLEAALAEQGVNLQELVIALENDSTIEEAALGRGLAGSVGTYVPGSAPTLYPPGSGMLVPAGSLLVMQVHYNLSQPPAPDRTQAILQIAGPDEETVALWGMALTAPVEIPCPAGVTGPACERTTALQQVQNPLLPNALLARCGKTQADYAGQSAARATSDCAYTLYGAGWVIRVGPHMHGRGQSTRLTLNPDTAQATVLIDIPRWDFHWQGGYMLAAPVRVEPGDVIRLTCTWDNSRGERYIVWGEGTDDEMCLALVVILPAAAGQTLADFGYVAR